MQLPILGYKYNIIFEILMLHSLKLKNSAPNHRTKNKFQKKKKSTYKKPSHAYFTCQALKMNSFNLIIEPKVGSKLH